MKLEGSLSDEKEIVIVPFYSAGCYLNNRNMPPYCSLQGFLGGSAYPTPLLNIYYLNQTKKALWMVS